MHKIKIVSVLLAALAMHAIAEDWLYTVRPGETLSAICEQYVKEEACWRKLVKHNDEIPDDGSLQAGLSIKIPVAWLLNPPVAVNVEYVFGDAYVLRRRTQVKNQLNAGMLLQMGDGVVTANGKVLLRFADGSSLLLKPQTEIVLDRLSTFDKSGMVDTNVRLRRGSGHFKIESQEGQGRYRISTPSAIAAVRGTQFRVSSDRDAGDIMRNEVLEGSVQVSASNADQTVNEGYGTLAESGKQPIEPKKLLPPPEFELAETVNVPKQLSWKAVAGARSYIVDIFAGDTTERLRYTAETQAPAYLLDTMDEGRYTLAVRGVDELGLQGLNNVKHMDVTKNLHSPQISRANIRRQGDALQISWQAVDGAVAYQLELSKTKDFSDPVYSAQVDGNAATIMQPAGKYYLRTQTIYAQDVRSDYGELVQWGDPKPRQNIWPILLPALAWIVIILI